MNEQVILSVTKRADELEVTTRGSGIDQLEAIRVAAAATFRVLTDTRRVQAEMAAAMISGIVLEGIRKAEKDNCGMTEIETDRGGR